MTLALEERLIAQALMRAQKITSGAFRSSIITQQRISRVGQKTNWIVLFSIIGFAILSFCISFLTITAITRPLNKLVKSAEIIGEGNLDHRVDIKTKNEIGGLAVAFDQMTERRKLAEERLRQSEAKYLDLYSSAPVAYLSVGTDGLIKTANKAAEDLTCYRSEELQGMKVFNLYPEESKEKAKELFEKFRRGIPLENEEMIYKRKDGHKIHGLLSVSPIKDENGLVLESRSVVVDITERKRAEEELEKHRENLEELVRERTAELEKRVSEVEQLNSAMVNLMEDLRSSNRNLEITTRQLGDANKELEAFAYSVSHDLRAPLRAIDGFSQSLLEDYSDALDDQGKHYLQRVRAGTQNMGRLIDDILNLSRIGRQPVKKEKVNLEIIIREAYRSLEDEWKDREVDFTVHECPLGFGDPHLMKIVFVNLFSNALKFTRDRETAEIEVGSKTEDKQTVFFIKDNGAGFDMKYADKLFTPFQRLHRVEEYEGTGIGLAIVQRIINRHSGRIWVESELDVGTTFYFTL